MVIRNFAFRCGCAWLVLIGLALALPQSTGGQTALTMRTAMSEQEFAASGVGALGSDQQAALDRWLNRWTTLAFNVSCGGTYSNTGEKQSIEENADGAVLILDDESIWLVESTDRVDSSLWLASDDVIVTQTKQRVAGYDYTIIDLDDKERVLAKYMGQE